MSGRRVFITGGASGLGRALAERYASAGYRVCVGDIHDERGREVARSLGGSAQYLPCDVTREDDLAAAAAWLERQWGGVDLVFNNAGVALGGSIEETSLDDWQWAIDINLLGVVRGCKVFTPLLRKNGGGRIVNVSSMAGLVHPPIMSAYCATKAAVVALSETLQLELARDNIQVSVVCPAFFRTNLTETLRAPNPDVERVTRRLVERAKVGAPEIADRVFHAVERGEFHILTHPEGKAIWMLKRLAPFALYLASMSRSTRKMMTRRAPAGGAEVA